jgi:hypothetical protein
MIQIQIYQSKGDYNMNERTFQVYLNEIIDEILAKNTLKGGEYARNNDRFHNFIEGSNMLGMSLPMYLMSLRSKHEVSILDMCRDLEHKPPHHHSLETWKEKITDSIMYSIILYAYVCGKAQEELSYD